MPINVIYWMILKLFLKDIWPLGRGRPACLLAFGQLISGQKTTLKPERTRLTGHSNATNHNYWRFNFVFFRIVNLVQSSASLSSSLTADECPKTTLKPANLTCLTSFKHKKLNVGWFNGYCWILDLVFKWFKHAVLPADKCPKPL